MSVQPLHALIGAFFIFSCVPLLSSAISCYTNSFKNKRSPYQLFGDQGRKGIHVINCPNKTECYEILAKPDVGWDAAVYYSGCAKCPKWRGDVCNKCNQSNCNRNIIKSIWKSHRECFYADDDTVLDQRRTWCNKDIDSCFWIQTRDKNSVIRYTADCGKGLPGSTTCKENLCNAPPEIREKLQDEIRVSEARAAEKDASELPSEQDNSSGGSSGSSGSRDDGEKDKRHDSDRTSGRGGNGNGESAFPDHEKKNSKANNKSRTKSTNSKDAKSDEKPDIDLGDTNLGNSASKLFDSDAAIKILFLIPGTLAIVYLP